MPSSETRACSICRAELPFTRDFFNSDVSRKTGLSEKCKACNRESCKARRHANLKAARERDRRRYHQVPERRASTRGRAAASYANNRTRVISRSLARNRSLAAAGRPKLVSERAKINARIGSRLNAKVRKAAEGNHTVADVLRMRADQNGRCFYCQRPMNSIRRSSLQETVDHVVALSKGGTHWPSNLVLACMECNFTKLNRPVTSFLSMPGRPRLDTPERVIRGASTRGDKPITFDGDTKPLRSWAEALGVSVVTLWNRLSRGIEVDRALSGKRMYGRKKEGGGV